MTGASMAALCVSGVPNTDPDILQAKAFLKSKLINTSGAFNAMYGINTSSNGWAVSGLNACGINPQTGDFLTAAGSFTAGTATKLALSVDDGAGTLKVCSVAFTPTGAATTLGDVLAAATGASTPAGCVTGVVPATGTGAVTSVNGKPNAGSATWKVSVDGSAFAGAARDKVIGVGDTIALRYS